MSVQRKLVLPVNFLKVCVVLNTTDGLSFKCIAALPTKKQAEWIMLSREKLEQAGCKSPEGFVAPYILLYYVTCKYNLGIGETTDIISVPQKRKVYTDVMSRYKKLGSHKKQRWSEVVPKVLRPPMGPFSYHLFGGNNVIRYNGTIRNLYILNEKILKQVDFVSGEDFSKLFPVASKECHLTFQQCLHVLQDGKFSGRSEGILKQLSGLHKVRNSAEDHAEETVESHPLLSPERTTDVNLSLVFDDVTQDLIKTKDEKISPDPAYYLGTNADWRHIKAGQDVIREDLMARIFGCFYKKNICGIRGETGQGKSTLMYRFAFEYQDMFYIYQVKHLNRYLERQSVRALCQAASFGEKPLLILMDNVIKLPCWDLFLNSLKNQKNLYILMTVSEHDWYESQKQDLVGCIEFVTPILDLPTAKLIYEKLNEQQLTNIKEDEWGGMLQMSQNRMIEYVTLIIRKTALEEILDAQLVQLKNRNAKARDVLRIIATIHTLGLSATFSLLKKCLKISTERLVTCLEELDGEFIWKYHGVYMCRSKVKAEYMMRILHYDYPIGQTLTTIFQNMRFDEGVSLFSGLLEYYPSMAVQIAEILFEKIDTSLAPETLLLFIRNVPTAVLKSHAKSLKAMAADIANNYRRVCYGVENLAANTYSFLQDRLACHGKLIFHTPEKSDLRSFMEKIYKNLDTEWLFSQIMETKVESAVGIISFYFTVFFKEQLSNLKAVLVDKCKKVTLDFACRSSSPSLHTRMFLEGISAVDTDIAKSVVIRLFTEAIPKVIFEEKNYRDSLDLLCVTIKSLDRDLASSIVKTIGLPGIKRIMRFEERPIDFEGLLPIIDLVPEWKAGLLNLVDEINSEPPDTKVMIKGLKGGICVNYEGVADKEHWSAERILALSPEDGARQLNSVSSIERFNLTLRDMIAKDENKIALVIKSLDPDEIVKHIDFHWDAVNSEGVIYQLLIFSPEKGQKVAERVGISNLGLLRAKVEFDIKRRNT